MMRYGKYSILVILLVTAQACAPDYFSAQKTAERRKAVELREAAEAGDAEAQLNLGVCYANGTGVSQDLDQAALWFRKAAEQGHVKGQFALGHCYTYGDGVPKDMMQAAEWFRKAAEQGHADAQSSLGLIYSDCAEVYADCEGITEDIPQAVAWFRRAAVQGNGFSMRILGGLYARSEEFPKDLISAYQWCDLATKHGWDSKELLERMDELAKQMTPEQMAEAKQRTEAFVPEREGGGES